MTFLQRTFTSLVHAHAGRTQAAAGGLVKAPASPPLFPAAEPSVIFTESVMELDDKKLIKAAADYCEFWYKHDRKFSEFISGSHHPMSARVDVLKQCLCAYGIQRNVQPNKAELKNYDDGYCGDNYNPEKHKVIIEVLDDFKITGSWVDDVYQLEGLLHQGLANEVRVLSLASKVLWQKVRGQYIVFDTDARLALKTANKDISAFYNEWTRVYESNLSFIVDALEKVLERSPFMFYRYDDYRQDWFYRRILDTYLINITREVK